MLEKRKQLGMKPLQAAIRSSSYRTPEREVSTPIVEQEIFDPISEELVAGSSSSGSTSSAGLSQGLRERERGELELLRGRRSRSRSVTPRSPLPRTRSPESSIVLTPEGPTRAQVEARFETGVREAAIERAAVRASRRNLTEPARGRETPPRSTTPERAIITDVEAIEETERRRGFVRESGVFRPNTPEREARGLVETISEQPTLRGPEPEPENPL